MQLVIDIGNTRLKTALFEGANCIKSSVFTTEGELLTYIMPISATIQSCIVASVAQNTEVMLTKLATYFKTIAFTSNTSIPIQNKYTSASTLGSDRLAAAIGAWERYPNQNSLVIDIGTCIKYNFTNAHNEYIGGAISPGQRLRYQSLHDYTARLPLHTFDHHYDILVGSNTKESILTGVQIGMLHEIEGFIYQYEQLYAPLNVLLTGGDAPYFASHIKKPIFVDDLLILKGLNQVLLFQS